MKDKQMIGTLFLVLGFILGLVGVGWTRAIVVSAMLGGYVLNGSTFAAAALVAAAWVLARVGIEILGLRSDK